MAKLTARLIEERHKQFEAGDAAALLDAVDLCARSGTAMPPWVVDGFCSRYAAWASFQAKTLDEAFAIKRKGTRVPDRARRERLMPRVVLEVERLRKGKEKPPLDEELFRCVGKGLKIKGGMARDIYYDSKNRWRDLFRAMPPKKF